jgi:hypothetical protein
MSIKKTSILLLISSLSITVAAQSGGPAEFEYVRRSDARLTGENPAGLHALSLPKISIAEAYFSKSNGNFINYYQSNDSYEAGAVTESFFRLNPKTVLYGKVNYSNFTGKNMGGSAFIDPNERVFDIQETTDSTRGSKNQENYFLVGAVSVKPSERFAIGGRIDYRAANYSKFKDLRHSNKLFDLTAIVGVSYSFGTLVDLGLNYFYRRNVEDVEFSRHGTTDRQYHSLISFGSFYGRAELFGGEGYTDPSERKPAVGEWNGGSLQLRFKLGKQSVFFNEISWRRGTGYFGKRSPRTPVYLEHRVPMWIYKGNFSLRQGNNHHILTADVERETLKNYENIYRIETQDGRTNVVYLDKNLILNRSAVQSAFGYTLNLNVANNLPTWIVGANVAHCLRRQTASIYPYFRQQNISQVRVNLSVARNIIHRKNVYNISIAALYGSGSGTPRNDDVYAAPAETQRPPKNNDILLDREYEYLTATRAGGNIGFALTRILGKGLHGYIKLNYEFTKASGIEHLHGSSRRCAAFRLGCLF